MPSSGHKKSVADGLVKKTVTDESKNEAKKSAKVENEPSKKKKTVKPVEIEETFISVTPKSKLVKSSKTQVIEETTFSAPKKAAKSATTNGARPIVAKAAKAPKIAPKPPRKLFHMEVSKGYVLKVVFDTLAVTLSRCNITIDKTGFYINTADDFHTILFDIDFPRKNFKDFSCKKKMTISVNLKHMQPLLKNVKKKDSIVMYIEEGSDKLCINITPGGNKENPRFERNGIVFQTIPTPEKEELPNGGYKHPMVIESNDFQKIKKLTSVGKQITVQIQDSNYISFDSDAGVVYTSALIFGTLKDPSEYDDEDECDESDGTHVEGCKHICRECGDLITDCWCVCTASESGKDQDGNRTPGCGEYMCNCTCCCETCEEYLCDCRCGKEEKHKIFTAKYSSSIFAKLIKIPSLSSHLQFYAPSIDHFPLLIEVNAGVGTMLGTIKIFIKDTTQISWEASQMRDLEVMVAQDGKKKSKK
jgi:hypothetical protein